MSGQYLANPSGDCCFQAVKHSGTPTGEEAEIGGAKCYIGKPGDKDSGNVIIFYPDVFGPWYLNNQLLVDFFAQGGYTVVAPDYFEGDKLEELNKVEGFDRQAWIHKKMALAGPLLEKFHVGLKEKFGAKKYATVGYCFGGIWVVKALAAEIATAGAAVHPAFIKTEDLENMKKGAIFFSCAEIDHTFPAPNRHKAEEIVVANKVPYHFQLFSGVSHGFAIRGDPNNENERWAKETSAWSILGWFDRFLK